MTEKINIISASIRDSVVLHIGIILQCNKQDNFGVVLGYSRSDFRGNTMVKMGFPILSYFEKEQGLQLKEKTFVVYITKDNNFECAFGIKELSSFKLINSSIENEIQSFSPFIQMETGFKCLYYPTKTNKIKNYFENVLVAEEKTLFECFLALNEIEFETFPSYKEMEDIFHKIHAYVANFDIEKELKTYNVIQSAWFKCRPGRDDQYFMKEERSIESTDSYIRSLLPLCNKLDYYSCCGRDSDEIDFIKRNEAQIKEDKINAIKQYSKSNHINYLVHEYYEHIFNNKDKKDEIWTKIENILDLYHIEQCCGKYFYGFSAIKHYNTLRQKHADK